MTYEIRFSAAAAARYRDAVGQRGRVLHGLRRLANRARLYAGSLRARTAAGALAEPGRLIDGVAIRWVPHRDGSLFVIHAGWELIACDVLPDERVVLVLAIARRHELAARLGVRLVRIRAVPVGSFGWRP